MHKWPKIRPTIKRMPVKKDAVTVKTVLVKKERMGCLSAGPMMIAWTGAMNGRAMGQHHDWP